MKKTLIALALALAAPAYATDAALPGEAEVAVWAPLPAEGLTLDQFKWRARPVVVFADSPFDPAFIEQMDLLEARAEALVERDVVVIYDTDPAARSAIRTALRPRGFGLVLIDKQGRVNLRKPFPWDVREISASIDKWPMRQQELRDQRLSE